MKHGPVPSQTYDIMKVPVGAGGSILTKLHAIGTGIIGGMLASTVIAIFFVPLFFVLLEGLTGLFDRRAQSRADAGMPAPAAPHAKREDD